MQFYQKEQLRLSNYRSLYFSFIIDRSLICSSTIHSASTTNRSSANNNFKSRIEDNSRNLLSKEFKQKLIFFHKNAHPELWGIIDGQYKYIVIQFNQA